MFDAKAYDANKIRYQNNSAISGQTDEFISVDAGWFMLPILREWLDDNNLQEITLVSTNIGFVKTFTKTRRHGSGHSSPGGKPDADRPAV